MTHLASFSSSLLLSTYLSFFVFFGEGLTQRGALLLDVYGDLTPKNALERSAPRVVGGGTLLVSIWLRGLVQLLVATIVRIISNNGSMVMVAKILSLMMTTILNYSPRTRNT